MNEFENDGLFKRIDIGIRRGAAKALAEHKRSGRCIVIWENGRVVKIPPEEIQVPEEYIEKDK
jgi:hypothetical protein